MNTVQGPKKKKHIGLSYNEERKAQRIRIQRPMKEKGFKKYTKEKGKAQSTRVSKPKKKKPRGNQAGIPKNARV